MGSDVSRVRFDTAHDFAAVVLQQGRVLLDADFNEVVAILDRRLRAETIDLTSFGPDPDHAGVAWVPRQTPNGFLVTATGGKLTIGQGRMYVDGVLAENHGAPPLVFDPLLAESHGTGDLDYDRQPYWPSPDPLPAGGPHLAYLDVWEREVTALEDPDLVEPALGVDSTARLQTAWQVRLLANVGNITCDARDADIPGWSDMIAPSAGRLTTGTVPVDPKDDPCALPPSGGYRGLENQTYRVEIHDGGAPGVATFKWSRENGSVAFPVVEMVKPTVLRLASIGKDDVLRVSPGDWVEILDDNLELQGTPGEIRKVTVDDAAHTITFAPALPAALQPADANDAAARHLRVRRWDQSGIVHDGTGAVLTDLNQVGSTGLITVPAASSTSVQLEHGIIVEFSLDDPSGAYRAGDYWIFAARTADTSVENLDYAPPLGVHHHYARLGTVTLPDGETDCRRKWPPDVTAGGESCECTVCVAPGRDARRELQDALDTVKAAGGGTVCLTAGIYDLGDGIRIDGMRSLRLRGQGPATILAARGTVIDVERSFAITIENLAVVGGAGAAAAIQLRNVVGVTVENVVALSYRSREGQGAAIALEGLNARVALRRNVLVAPTGVDGGAGEKVGLLALALTVDDNVVAGFVNGIHLGGTAAYLFECGITRNDIVAGPMGAIVATGAVAPGGTLDVTGNTVATTGAGVVIGVDARVRANTVNGLPGQAGTDGIVVERGGLAAAPGHVDISGNRVHERTGTGVAVRAPVRTLLASHNVVAGAGEGIAIEGHGSADHACLDHNEVLDIVGAQETRSALGIAVTRAQAVEVVNNNVIGVGQASVDAFVRAGIAVTACADTRVHGNVVDAIGPRDRYVGLAAGIVVAGPFERASIGDNSSRFGPETAAREEGRWHALVVESPVRTVAKLGAQTIAVPTANGAVMFNGLWAWLVPAGGDHVSVAANSLKGGGSLPTWFVQTRGDIVADANQCEHLQPGEPLAAVLGGTSITVATNRVRGPKAMLVLETGEGRYAAVGNLTGGGTYLGSPGGSLSSPWDGLNPIVP